MWIGQVRKQTFFWELGKRPFLCHSYKQSQWLLPKSGNFNLAKCKINGLICVLEQTPRQIRYGWYFFLLSRFTEKESKKWNSEDKKNVWQWTKHVNQFSTKDEAIWKQSYLLKKAVNFYWENRKIPKITHLTFHLFWDIYINLKGSSCCENADKYIPTSFETTV